MFDFGLYTQVSDSGPHGPLVHKCFKGPKGYLKTIWVMFIDCMVYARCADQSHRSGPVVQSVVSLTSSLNGQLVKCFTTL